MSSDVDSFLAHYGVKGMKWGVRKKSSGESSGGSSEEHPVRDHNGKLSLKNPKVRRAAVVGASVVAIGAAAFVASRYMDKPVDTQSIKKGAEKVADILQQPTDIIYMSKPHKGSGSRTTLGFVSEGQTKDYFKIFDDAGLNSDGFKPGDFKKLSNGNVATYIADMMGRVDSAGRKVPHVVLIPADKAVGLNSMEDVVKKYGPELERRYQTYLEERRKTTPEV
ncbi:gp016 [Rhodococcus phage ReqiPepy6]|uniref:Gp016 n=1 Tax=Rhodococcus phage ReqiPepy6 TaxID=691965 RepID=D4P7C7_9CAUD|nr:gp016 [Rhodococcus phage ReqiPepy6]ADD80907.1 gp016 [Rhodococcus phage ReqiPepy6]